MINAAYHGQGVVLGRMTLTQQHRRDKRLATLFGEPQRLARSYYAVFGRGASDRPDVVRFVDWMKREIGTEQEAPG